MISKRTFLSTATALFATTSFMTTPAFAIGGDDPISGIDIIIKKNPGSKPVMDTGFGRGQLGQLNETKGRDRPKYIASVVSELVKKLELDRSFQDDLYKALADKWSEKSRPEKILVNARSGNPEQKEQGYTLTVIIKGK